MAVPGKKVSQKFSPTLSGGSAKDYEVYCQPCDREDVRVLADGYCVDCEEHLCDLCLNHHKKAKPSRHHKLLDKTTMPSIQQPSTTPAPFGQSLTKPCSKHSQEFIKFYCQDHKALLCNVCVTLQHTVTSCHVDYIPDVSGQVVDSKEYTDTLKEMDNLSDICQKITADLKEMVTKSNGSLADVLAEIKKFRQEINQRLDKLEKEAEDAAKALKQENDETLRTAETTCNNIVMSLKASVDNIQLLKTTNQADRLFIELKSAGHQIKEKGKCISQLESSDVKQYHFRPNQAIETLLKNEECLCTLTERKLTLSSSTTSIPSKKKFNLLSQNKIQVKMLKDKNRCCVTAMEVLNPSRLVIVDRGNDSMKLVDINSSSVIDQLLLNYWAQDVASVTDDQLVVTLPTMQAVMFVSVSSNKLTKQQFLKVHGKCFGISCYQGKLLVSFKDPAHLRVIDLTGTVHKTFTTDSSGVKMFKTPEHLAVNSSHIYISDWQQHTVLGLNWQGELTGRQSGMGSPRGLAMLDDGSFLVCDYSDDRCNIQRGLYKQQGHSDRCTQPLCHLLVWHKQYSVCDLSKSG